MIRIATGNSFATTPAASWTTGLDSNAPDNPANGVTNLGPLGRDRAYPFTFTFSASTAFIGEMDHVKCLDLQLSFTKRQFGGQDYFMHFDEGATTFAGCMHITASGFDPFTDGTYT
jgi:hypothetical protein